MNRFQSINPKIAITRSAIAFTTSGGGPDLTGGVILCIR